MIRTATMIDFPLVLPLLKFRAQEEALHGPFDLAAVRECYRQMVQQSGVVGLIEGERGAEATIGLVICRMWWTRENHLEALWTFVHPDYRRSDHAKDLLTFAKEVSDRLGMPLIGAQHESDATAPKVRLLERTMGRAGMIFRHEPSHA